MSDILLNSKYFNKLNINKLLFNKLKLNDLVGSNSFKLKSNPIIYNTFINNNTQTLKFIKKYKNKLYYKLEFKDFIKSFNKIFNINVIDITGPFTSIGITNDFFEQLYEGYTKNGRNFNIDSIDFDDIDSKINNSYNEQDMNYNIVIKYFDGKNIKNQIFLTLLSVYKDSDIIQLSFFFDLDSELLFQNGVHDTYKLSSPHHHLIPLSLYTPEDNINIVIPEEDIFLDNFILDIYLFFVFAIVTAAIEIVGVSSAATAAIASTADLVAGLAILKGAQSIANAEK